jgi:hypothetical protein
MNPQPPVQPVSARFPALEEQEIILTLFDPEAREANVAGNFNGWLAPDCHAAEKHGRRKMGCSLDAQVRSV